MADGTKKQLRQLRPGDEVASWDENAGRVTKSVVQAVPSHRRDVDEIMEVTLPQGVFLATVDHPFWSSAKRGLVSVHPRGTMRDYGLQAEVMSPVEQLEGERNGTVHNVTAVWRRAPAAALLRRGRRLAAPPLQDRLLEVATLCLHPFHWFFVHGVRVHNKGCFIKTSEVSMASGLKKSLHHVQVGEEVVSWDSERQRVATSMVVVAPTYVRDAAELVEIRLPHARIFATEDHPFWSKSRNALVSARPNRTMEEYKLHAHSLMADEVLEGEQYQGVRVSDILRPPLSTLNTSRRLSGTSSGLEVMTLCLHPFPWFYVHGVRVHNKGCFAPWVRVLLSNGTEVPISSVRAQDHVVSWDATVGAQVDAKVLSVKAFPTAQSQLLELSFKGSSSERRLGSSTGLVLTADHPVYSSRWGGIVSLHPEATLETYGFQAGQLQQHELLQHHLGHEVEAAVEPWRGDSPLEVMTLQLERHHWFYAEGVRVHNKGGSFGGSGGSSRPVYRHRSYFSSPHGFSLFILSHSRRRYGTWVANDGGCTYTSSAAVPGGVQQVCQGSVGNMSSCERCDQCTAEPCIKSIPNCTSFLSNLYEKCKDDQNYIVEIICFFVAFSGLFGLCIYCMAKQSNPRLAKEREERLAMEGENGQGLVSVAWKGSYTENLETKDAEYRWSFDDGSGDFTGTGTDDDGVAEVQGVMVWSAEANVGQVRWVETRPGVSIEASGSLSFQQQGSQQLFGMQQQAPLYLHATYTSSTGVDGSTTLYSTEVHAGGPVVPVSNMQEEMRPLTNYAARH